MIIRVLTAAKGLPLPQLVVPHTQPSGITVRNSNHFGTSHTHGTYPISVPFTPLGLKQSGIYNESRIFAVQFGPARSGLWFDLSTWVRRELPIAEARNSSETISIRKVYEHHE